MRNASLADRLKIEVGEASDYAALAHHHYRAKRPATMTRVLVIRNEKPDGLGPFFDDKVPAPLAVLVESLPTLSCRLRDAALDNRYGALPVRQRAKLLNEEVRCISRVIVDPRFRGFGMAGVLVAHALSSPQTPYTEALAAMGRVSPFFKRAGMTPYHRPPHAHDARLIAALKVIGDPPVLIAQTERLLRRIEKLPKTPRAWLTREFGRWHRTAKARGGRRRFSLEQQLVAARERLFSTPVYYLHDNRADLE